MSRTLIKYTSNSLLKDKILKALEENDGHCPCMIQKTPDTKCVCTAFREQDSGPCHCGLFIKEKTD